MAVRTQPTLSPSISTKLTEAMTLSPPSFCKRYKSSYETPSSSSSSPTLPLWKRYRGTSELIADTETESDESEDEGTDLESEEVALEDQQLLVRTTWEDPEDDTVYMDIEWDMPPVHSPIQIPPSLVGIPSSPGWFLEPLSDSPVPATVIDEDDFLEIGAQLELLGSILHDHIERLDALPPTIFKGYGQDFTELFARSGAVREEIHSQCFRLRSLEQGYKDQREIHDLRMQRAADQCELQELRDRVTALERRMDRIEEYVRQT
ncbi:hypothetical protein Tco_0232759 [Tanacetum coccineum]